jgi:hypothetical protein
MCTNASRSCTAAAEAMHMTGHALLHYSQLTCRMFHGAGDLNNYACDGGWYAAALQYIIDQGITSSDVYPYVSKSDGFLQEERDSPACH